MTLPTIGVPRETLPRERRVALDPSTVGALVRAGHAVHVEAGAGRACWFTDADYRSAGAVVASRSDVMAEAEVVVALHAPPIAELRRGQTLIGLLGPLAAPADAAAWAQAGVDTVSLDLLPRMLSSAQAMDALTSQASVAGYKAAVLSADLFGGFFPMLMTASGTVRPARVLVLGGGVAGLQAIGTAIRLGAVVDGYDVRAEARADVESVGGRFVALTTEAGSLDAGGEGGYARALDADEAAAQQAALAAVIAQHDVVISTAAVPAGAPHCSLLPTLSRGCVRAASSSILLPGPSAAT